MPSMHPSTMDYLAPTDEQKARMADVRQGYGLLLQLVEKQIPDGRYRALAVRALEEAAMWSNKGITRASDGTPWVLQTGPQAAKVVAGDVKLAPPGTTLDDVARVALGDVKAVLHSILVARGKIQRKVTFGRRRPSKEQLARVPKLRKYLLETTAPGGLPTPPDAVDYSLDAMPCLSQVMLNNQLGDCTCAGAYHALGLWTGNAGALFTATDAEVLALYEACGGYKPGDPSTDQGCDEVTVLDYLCKTGFADGSKLAGYVSVDPTNQQECQLAAYLFESLYFGVGLPDQWIAPFPSGNGFTWDVGTPDDNNGHCFVATGYDPRGVQVDTWGLLGTVTWAAMAQVIGSDGQLYALLSEDSIAKATGKSPAGFDFATLQADLQALNGRGGLSA